MANDPYAEAAYHAEKVLRERNIASLPVDPMAIAKVAGIEVMAKPASAAGVSGMLLKVGDRFGIAYATHIDNSGFQRFSVSHELGTIFCPDMLTRFLAPTIAMNRAPGLRPRIATSGRQTISLRRC